MTLPLDLPSPAGWAEARVRALAEPARRRVWDAVRAAGRPVGVAELARRCGVHPNTIRLHLARLVDAGLVAEEREPDRHPGRPGYRYRPLAEDPVSEAVAYRRLAGLLASALRRGESARQAGRAAGARAATAAGAAAAVARDGGDPVAAVIDVLAEEGFDPEPVRLSASAVEIVLRRCPFWEVAAEDPAVVCELHRGLAEGAAESIGGLTVEGLQVAEPGRGACRLRLRVVQTGEV